MKTDSANSANPQRNQAIIWARYQIDAKDWNVLATRLTNNDGVEVLSASVVSADGKTLLEALVKPQGEVSSEIFALHGAPYSVIFNALSPEAFIKAIAKCLEGKKVLAWDFEESLKALNDLSRAIGMSDVAIFGEGVKTHYRKFSGEPGPTVNAKSATDECKALVATITEMAASSQKHDGEDVARQGWTAEFYKPKPSPAQKFKDILGL